MYISKNLGVEIHAILRAVILCQLITIGAVGVRGIRVDTGLELGVVVMRKVVVTVGPFIVLALL